MRIVRLDDAASAVAIAFSVFALLGAPAAWPASSAAAAGPTAGAAKAVQQQARAAPRTEQTPEPPGPASIPVPEIAKRAEEVTGLLRGLQALAAPVPAIEAIRARLPEVSARLGSGMVSTIKQLEQNPTLVALDRMSESWRLSCGELGGGQDVLTKRASHLERELDRLAALRARWMQARADAQASRAPTPVVRRVDAVLADIEATRARLQAERAATLVLQDGEAREVARCEDALARIDRVRKASVQLMFVRTTPPIWSPELRWRDLEELPAGARAAAVASVALLRQFAGDKAVRLLLHGLLFFGLVLLARAGRRWAHRLAAAGERPLPAAALFDRPYSLAVVAAMVAIFWIHPDRPRIVADLGAVLVLLPLVRIARPLMWPGVAPALYGLAALGLLDRARAELAVIPLADQVLLLLEMLGVVIVLAWLLRSGRLRREPAAERIAPEPVSGVQVAAGLALGLYATLFAAAAYGTLRPVRMLGSGLLVGALLGILSYAAVQVMDGLLAFAFRTWPLQPLGMVKRHRDLLERRAHRLLCWIMAGVWAAASLRNVALLESAVDLGQAVLAAELRRGTIAISLGDVLGFVITVWLAFLLSAFIRFVLEEDVYPHLRLMQGLPYVVSSLLHYAILLLGFLLAVAALGVDLNKATVLAGAFGVGLGFGLQGVVNNFVSGLIVLFERPIRVGDAIQMSDLAGEVRRIGLRSTTVHTWEGAEVIVPNASLTTNNVTNWTLSDRRRRIDIAVGVAYDTPPDKMLGILLGVARAHPLVLREPAPAALCLAFGDSALQFEMRVWTDRFDLWLQIKSDLIVALHAALREAGIEIPFPHREVRLL